jgi:hypothetical protein
MPTDSPSSVAREVASDQGCAATGRAIPPRSARNIGCFWVVHDKLGRSIDEPLFATASFSGSSIRFCCLCGKHGPRLKMVTRKWVDNSQTVCSPNVDGPRQPDCGTRKRKGPEGPFVLGDRAAYPNYFFAAGFAFLAGAAALAAGFALGATGAATAGATFSAVR